MKITGLLTFAMPFFITNFACGAADNTCPLVHPGPDGKLVYKPYDAQGDTIPDFSNCGYEGGGVALPDVATKLTLHPVGHGADDTARIQQAIDKLSRFPMGHDGYRGALLLTAGTYHIAGTLRIQSSGIVLRGAGEDQTTLLATGSKQRIVVHVDGPRRIKRLGGEVKMTDAYVPVGARSFQVADAAGLHRGDHVLVIRHGNAAWIHTIGMDHIMPRPKHPSKTHKWKPFDLRFDRVITAVQGKRVTVDAPITCAIDQKWGGGDVERFKEQRIDHVGVENLRIDSDFDRSKTRKYHGKKYFCDEGHATHAVTFDHVINGWARHITAVHMVNGTADTGRGAKWITIENCTSLKQVSIITGGRRYPFTISGQLVFVYRCKTSEARHAFPINSRVPGPSVFLDCTSVQNYADSGPHQRWSVGQLWDNVQGTLRTQDRQWMGTGHGWAGANDVYWNCSGQLIVQQPPTAQNFAIGFVGKKLKPSFPQMHHPFGYTDHWGAHVTPRSLYLAQLRDRLGPDAVRNIQQKPAP